MAEERDNVDAGKKIARAAGSPGRAGVITELGLIQRELHERGHRQRRAFTDQVSNLQSNLQSATSNRQFQSFLTGTKTSLSPRHTRSCARRPDAIFWSSRAASAALETVLPFTDRITSPWRSPPADGPSGSTSGM